MKKIKIKEAGERLDVFLTKKFPELSRTKIQKKIKSKEILVNDKETSPHYKLKEEDIISFGNKIPAKIIKKNKEEIKASKELFKKIKVIKKTKEYLVLYKPAGLIVHGAEHIKVQTLVDWLLVKYPKIARVGDDPLRPGIVHRLDKEVSGLIVIALNTDSFDNLKNQFIKRKIKKVYTALVYEKIDKDYDVINFSIKRSSDGHKMAAVPYSFGENLNKATLKSITATGGIPPSKKVSGGTNSKKKKGRARRAITEFEIKERFINYTLLSIKIKTGRTHQIRVHMYAYSHSIVGDDLYSTKKTREKNSKLGLDRVFLQATELCFYDLSGEKACFKIELDEKLKNLLKIIK